MALIPCNSAFIVRALIAAVVVGVVCSVLGTYVVLRGMAFFGDALAHTILPGVVIAFLLGWPLAVGALIVGILAALGIGVAHRARHAQRGHGDRGDLCRALCLGIALLSTSGNYTIDLAHFLFGNLLGVSTADLWVIAGLGAVVLLTDLSVLQRVPGPLVRPGAGGDAAPADDLFALLAAGVDRGDHCDRAAGGGHRPDAGHVCHAGGDRLAADAPPPGDDGRRRGDRRVFGHRRALRLILSECGVGARVVLVATTIFLLVFLFAPRRGLIAARG